MSEFNPLPSPSVSSTPTSTPAIQVPGQPLRRLLPATAADMNARSLPRNPSPGPIATPPAARSASPAPLAGRKRRQATTAACGACRKRKSRCDGQRPVCSTCIDRRTDCEFDTNAAETHNQALKRKFNELQGRQSACEEIFDILRVRPEKDAHEILQRIRNGIEPTSILRHVNYGDVLLQLSLVPEARYRYEFPYMSEMPSFLMRRDNPYLDSELYACALRTLPNARQLQLPSHAVVKEGQSQSQSQSPDLSLDQQRAPYWKPYHAAHIIDPWLDAVQPSRWTSVSSDDGLMRKLLHGYLLYDCSWLAPFHKDHFLQDMANGRRRFCSELLTNTVLAIGCFFHRELENRAEYWNPRNIGYRFLAEARRLFEIETDMERPRGSPNDSAYAHTVKDWEVRRLTTIQAAITLNMIYNYNGSDKIGWRYTLRAIEMANEIGLFQLSRGDLDQDTRCVRDYTAWSIYLYQGTHHYHCFMPPLIKYPPESPLPDPDRDPDWYGELWVRYPLGPPRTPTHHGLVVKARADLLTICIEFASLAFKDAESESGVDVPVDQILGFYKRLTNWQQNLPGPLTPKKSVMPTHLKLHMYYNLILVNMLEPIIMHDWSDGALSDRAFPLKSPRDAYLDAKVHFETSVRLYYLRNGFEVLDAFLAQFLITLTQISIDTIKEDPESPDIEGLRSTVLLTTKGIYDMGRSMYVMRAILHVQIGRMLPGDVERLKHFANIDVQQETHAPLEQPISSAWSTYAVRYDQRPENLTSQLANLPLRTQSPAHPSSGPAGS